MASEDKRLCLQHSTLEMPIGKKRKRRLKFFAKRHTNIKCDKMLLTVIFTLLCLINNAFAGCKYTNPEWIQEDPTHLTGPIISISGQNFVSFI